VEQHPRRRAAAGRETGRLSNPRVFAAEVRRMMDDPKASALVSNFAGQWLQLRNLQRVAPDPMKYPDFDDDLRQAFRRETELLVESIVREDRSLLDLLRADYTYVNERLARHYGIPGISGSQFRRVRSWTTHAADCSGTAAFWRSRRIRTGRRRSSAESGCSSSYWDRHRHLPRRTCHRSTSRRTARSRAR
jgi:hypothetical protein